MSGIAGLVRFDGQPVAPGAIEAMLVPMRRRGPDRQCAHAEGSAGFGQVLLATTAEANAERQPWVHPGSGCVVVSDSRLDNRPQLMAELGIAGKPDEVGDGELLHAAWRRWGLDCADRLRGDFAFALWDPEARTLYCARDIMGVRPLYFHHVPGSLFAFASDADALLALPEVPRRINEGRIADALMVDLEGIDRTSTFFLDIERLPPARTLQVDANAARQREYWQPLRDRPSHLPETEAGWIEAVRSTLEDAVRCRLRGLGRVGSMVSGGLDSSSVAALAQGMLPPGEHLPTFSAINNNGPCVETSAVRSMLAAFDFDAHTVDVAALDDLVPAVQAQLDHLREPFDGTMALVSTVYAKAAGCGVRTVMDGMPADNLYTEDGLLRSLSKAGQWRRLWREATLLSAHGAGSHARLRAMRKLLGAVSPLWLRRGWDAYRQRLQFRAHLRASCLHPAFAKRVNLPDRHRRYRLDVSRTRLGKADAPPHCILTAAYITVAVERYNRVASFHGIEPRHPFLDRRMIELHAWLPLDLRARDGHYKWVLRAAMAAGLPRDVAWRQGKEHLGYLYNRRVTSPWHESAGPGALGALTPFRRPGGGEDEPGLARDDWMPALLAGWLRRYGNLLSRS